VTRRRLWLGATALPESEGRILRGYEHGAELAEDDAASARALAVLAHSLDPHIVRCDHGNFARGAAEIRGHGSYANGYERVSDLPARWEQTDEQRVEWERRHGVDNSDAT
jgi:hypothetical protein